LTDEAERIRRDAVAVPVGVADEARDTGPSIEQKRWGPFRARRGPIEV
jgi:hypothetical protein